MGNLTEEEILLNTIRFIANDYHELSYEKAYWQRDDWKKRARKALDKYYAEKENKAELHQANTRSERDFRDDF